MPGEDVYLPLGPRDVRRFFDGTVLSNPGALAGYLSGYKAVLPEQLDDNSLERLGYDSFEYCVRKRVGPGPGIRSHRFFGKPGQAVHHVMGAGHEKQPAAGDPAGWSLNKRMRLFRPCRVSCQPPAVPEARMNLALQGHQVLPGEALSGRAVDLAAGQSHDGDPARVIM